MELHPLMKSSPGVFGKTKPPRWEVFQSFCPHAALRWFLDQEVTQWELHVVH